MSNFFSKKKIIFIKKNLNVLQMVGYFFINFLYFIGSLFIFIANIFRFLITGKFFVKNFLESIVKFGIDTIPIITFTSLFTGSAIGIQLFNGFEKFGDSAIEALPIIVLKTMLKELGPVLCGIIIAARSSSSIAAEISSLKNNNQIDVLLSLSINPYNFLIIPRVLAMILFSPILLLTMVFIAKYGSYFVLVKFCNFSSYNYLDITLSALKAIDIKIGLVKIVTFTSLSSFIACFNGINTNKGSNGVISAVINTVVSSCLLILFFNFIITLFFNK